LLTLPFNCLEHYEQLIGPNQIRRKKSLDYAAVSVKKVITRQAKTAYFHGNTSSIRRRCEQGFHAEMGNVG